MALFNQRVGELRSPTASLEALQEINTICNDIALSQPALEALFDLPNLASQFNQTNSAPSIAMLEFVTQQKYETLGMESFSVATEGIISDAKNGFMKFIKWLKTKIVEILERVVNWLKGPSDLKRQLDAAEKYLKANHSDYDKRYWTIKDIFGIIIGSLHRLRVDLQGVPVLLNRSNQLLDQLTKKYQAENNTENLAAAKNMSALIQRITKDANDCLLISTSIEKLVGGWCMFTVHKDHKKLSNEENEAKLEKYHKAAILLHGLLDDMYNGVNGNHTTVRGMIGQWVIWMNGFGGQGVNGTIEHAADTGWFDPRDADDGEFLTGIKDRLKSIEALLQ